MKPGRVDLGNEHRASKLALHVDPIGAPGEIAVSRLWTDPAGQHLEQRRYEPFGSSTTGRTVFRDEATGAIEVWTILQTGELMIEVPVAGEIGRFHAPLLFAPAQNQAITTDEIEKTRWIIR